jgi:hypothetical protein
MDLLVGLVQHPRRLVIAGERASYRAQLLAPGIGRPGFEQYMPERSRPL